MSQDYRRDSLIASSAMLAVVLTLGLAAVVYKTAPLPEYPKDLHEAEERLSRLRDRLYKI